MYSEMEKEMFELWDFMTECGIATYDELGLACALCGRSLGTIERVLYIKTGYRSLAQIREAESEDE